MRPLTEADLQKQKECELCEMRHDVDMVLMRRGLSVFNHHMDYFGPSSEFANIFEFHPTVRFHSMASFGF